MDTVSLTRKGNARTQVEKKDGKIVMTYEGVLSADGKTFNVQMKGTNSQGQPVNNSLVYVKKISDRLPGSAACSAVCWSAGQTRIASRSATGRSRLSLSDSAYPSLLLTN